MRSTRLSLKTLLAISPLRGREEDEGDDAGNGNGEQGSQNRSEDEHDDDDDDEDDDPGTGGNSGSEDPQAKIKALNAEKDRHFRKRQKAEQENKELRERLDKLDRKDKSELENTKTDLQKVSEENIGLKKTIHDLALHNAFLSTNDITWHNPMRALQLADLSEVEIDEDGTVDSKALKAAMKKLATDEPYLVKSATQDDEDEDENSDRLRDRTGNPSSGSSTKAQREKKAREALMQKYPSLRR